MKNVKFTAQKIINKRVVLPAAHAVVFGMGYTNQGLIYLELETRVSEFLSVVVMSTWEEIDEKC